MVEPRGDAVVLAEVAAELEALDPRVAPGKVADLLVLGANPADDIRNLRQIEQVWVGGRKLQ